MYNNWLIYGLLRDSPFLILTDDLRIAPHFILTDDLRIAPCFYLCERLRKSFTNPPFGRAQTPSVFVGPYGSQNA